MTQDLILKLSIEMKKMNINKTINSQKKKKSSICLSVYVTSTSLVESTNV